MWRSRGVHVAAVVPSYRKAEGSHGSEKPHRLFFSVPCNNRRKIAHRRMKDDDVTKGQRGWLWWRFRWGGLLAAIRAALGLPACRSQRASPYAATARANQSTHVRVDKLHKWIAALRTDPVALAISQSRKRRGVSPAAILGWHRPPALRADQQCPALHQYSRKQPQDVPLPGLPFRSAALT